LKEEDEKRRAEESLRRKKDEIRLKLQEEEEQRNLLFKHVVDGNIEQVHALLDNPSTLVRCNEREKQRGKAGNSLLHLCVSNHTPGSITDTTSVEGRLEIAKYLLAAKSPPVDVTALDDSGRTVLHIAAANEDSKLIELLLEDRKTNTGRMIRYGAILVLLTGLCTERRSQLDINNRCLDRNWTPLHYAANAGSFVLLHHSVMLRTRRGRSNYKLQNADGGGGAFERPWRSSVKAHGEGCHTT
jgi:ankyrin repeat protein